jgi:transcriptional regulator with XRE-family HTH domain
MNLGVRLKQARESKRFSQQEIAHLLNISQKTLSNMESDKSRPTIEQLSKMSEIYEIDILELLSKEGITFNQHNQSGGENGIIHHHHYPEKLIESYEQRLEEQAQLILALKEEINKLKSSR